MLRLADDRVIAPDRAARRRIAARFARFGRAGGLLVFRVADTHIHLVAVGARATVTRMVRAVELGLRADLSLTVRWDQARYVPIRDQHHLERAFHYALRNEARHGLQMDVLQDGSALADLLGLRISALYLPERVRRVLPRVTRADLLSHLGVDTLVPSELPVDLLDAAMAALGHTELGGHQGKRARIAAVHACPGTSAAALAHPLGVTERTVQRYRSLVAEPLAVRAVQLQLGLRLNRGSAALSPRWDDATPA